jgi:hypothetical protein
LGATISASQGIGRATLAGTGTANRTRWLRRAFASLEVGLPADVPFEGSPDGVRFTSSLLTANGWWERQDLELEFSEGQLVARTDGSEPIVLADSVAEAAFDYLIAPGLDSRWTRRWQSPTSAPLAIRLRLIWLDSAQSADTLLFLVGGRG